MSELAPLVSAFLKASRFKCTGLVLDLSDKDSSTAVAMIRNRDALKSLAVARGIGARYIVLAGQLHRRHGGAFTAIVPANVGALCSAATAAHARLGEMGETNSMWFVIGEGVREAVMAALGQASAVEGRA